MVTTLSLAMCMGPSLWGVSVSRVRGQIPNPKSQTIRHNRKRRNHQTAAFPFAAFFFFLIPSLGFGIFPRSGTLLQRVRREVPDHHLVRRLLAELDGAPGVGVRGVLGAVVVPAGNAQRGAGGDVDRVAQVVLELPVEVVAGNVQQ